ncbi:MAG: hypothetical protein WCI72_00920 [archaeon]
MTNLDPRDVPYQTAFDEHMGLSLPLSHLLGNRIGFFIKNIEGELVWGGLELSFWKFEKDTPYSGRIHISPSPLSELILIEDLVVGEMPKDYPMIGERKTSKDEVDLSLYYPSREFWNFRIHYTNKGQLVDKEAKHLIAETRIRCSIPSNYAEEYSDSKVYVPPRKVVQMENGKWATKPN